jgi:predicted enzyme related to lactoylglutathione lyase
MKPIQVLVGSLIALGSALPSADAVSQDVQALEHVTIFVRDQDEALAWYVDRLGLVKVDDRRFGAGERWLTVSASSSDSTRIVLAVPQGVMQQSIGHQHNWVFRTGDCNATHERLTARGVNYVRQPQRMPWGCQAIIQDLYGNRIVLLEHASRAASGREDRPSD